MPSTSFSLYAAIYRSASKLSCFCNAGCEGSESDDTAGLSCAVKLEPTPRKAIRTDRSALRISPHVNQSSRSGVGRPDENTDRNSPQEAQTDGEAVGFYQNAVKDSAVRHAKKRSVPSRFSLTSPVIRTAISRRLPQAPEKRIPVAASRK